MNSFKNPRKLVAKFFICILLRMLRVGVTTDRDGILITSQDIIRVTVEDKN
jgi:hypothetical protein